MTKIRKFRDRWDDFTLSLLQFPLDIWKPGGSSHMKRQGFSSKNMNLTPKEEAHVDVAWASLDPLKIPLKTE